MSSYKRMLDAASKKPNQSNNDSRVVERLLERNRQARDQTTEWLGALRKFDPSSPFMSSGNLFSLIDVLLDLSSALSSLIVRLEKDRAGVLPVRGQLDQATIPQIEQELDRVLEATRQIEGLAGEYLASGASPLDSAKKPLAIITAAISALSRHAQIADQQKQQQPSPAEDRAAGEFSHTALKLSRSPLPTPDGHEFYYRQGKPISLSHVTEDGALWPPLWPDSWGRGQHGNNITVPAPTPEARSNVANVMRFLSNDIYEKLGGTTAKFARTSSLSVYPLADGIIVYVINGKLSVTADYGETLLYKCEFHWDNDKSRNVLVAYSGKSVHWIGLSDEFDISDGDGHDQRVLNSVFVMPAGAGKNPTVFHSRGRIEEDLIADSHDLQLYSAANDMVLIQDHRAEGSTFAHRLSVIQVPRGPKVAQTGHPAHSYEFQSRIRFRALTPAIKWPDYLLDRNNARLGAVDSVGNILALAVAPEYGEKVLFYDATSNTVTEVFDNGPYEKAPRLQQIFAGPQGQILVAVADLSTGQFEISELVTPDQWEKDFTHFFSRAAASPMER